MTNVLIACNDRVGHAMAGPGIRAWEMARALAAEEHAVRLSSPYVSDRTGEGFEMVHESESEVRRLEAWADVVIVQGFVLSRHPSLAATNKHLVVDIYDPFVLETLELHADEPLAARRLEHWPVLGTMLFQLRLGDFFICASDRQRDFWMGALMALDRVNPDTHPQDPDLRRLIEIVPFGVPDEPPRHSGKPAIRGVIPGFDAESRVAIWGGGIYKWFDPLSVVRAWPAVLESVPHARLVLPGTRHPAPVAPASDVGAAAIRLSEQLGLRGRAIHFTEDWIPYHRRQDFLLEADIGVSTHHRNLETRLSFRTRYLDYIWAGLPILGTEGDWFAEWVAAHGAGRVVPYGDVHAIAAGLVELLGDDRARSAAAGAVRREQARFTWSAALTPLLAYCAAPWRAADRTSGPRLEVIRNQSLLRIFGGAAEMSPPRDLARKVMWYWRREGTAAVARRAVRRAGRRWRISRSS